ncbi:MAG: TrkH family potassium uptake protein [Lachnospiraceae bacterium]|nr:TrkH family potassium uptake protein [Candidatus Equihabitans merdae]
MNYSVVFFVLGWIIRLEGLLMLLPTFTGFVYHEPGGFVFLGTAVACLLVGSLITHFKPENKQVYMRDGFVSVGLAWLVMSLIGAIPFVIIGDIPNYVNALFETVSGFTTTGSSILTEVESLSRAGLVWRSFSHWIGGMGVVVFMLAVIPLLGGTTLNLMKAESPGPVVGKLMPRIRQSAAVLYIIYLAITVTELIMLLIFGMPPFEALCHTFGTVGTGGFGVLNDSYMSYSPALRNITTFFMLLCGVNFNFYYFVLQKKVKDAFKMEEVRVYIGLVLASVLLIFLNLGNSFYSTGESLSHAFFQVGSIITTTGYSSADFQQWPEFSKTILVMLMLVGACAGSTGGGMKISRIIIIFKNISKELQTLLHPRLFKRTKMDGVPVAHETVRATNVFLTVYLVILVLSVLVISLDGFDFTTNVTAVIATISNIGPGLNVVGPTGNFSEFSVLSKFVLIFDMLAGRRELFPMLLLFSVKSWRKYS